MTGIAWQKAERTIETDDGIQSTYHINVGLAQANITLEKFNKTTDELIEYHNLKIGWYESK